METKVSLRCELIIKTSLSVEQILVEEKDEIPSLPSNPSSHSLPPLSNYSPFPVHFLSKYQVVHQPH